LVVNDLQCSIINEYFVGYVDRGRDIFTDRFGIPSLELLGIQKKNFCQS
jgi:hypothetical protein